LWITTICTRSRKVLAVHSNAPLSEAGAAAPGLVRLPSPDVLAWTLKERHQRGVGELGVGWHGKHGVGGLTPAAYARAQASHSLAGAAPVKASGLEVFFRPGDSAEGGHALLMGS
jgi:hypothetical protein